MAIKLASLQAYIVARPLDLPASAKDLFRRLRSELRAASDERRLRDSPADIYKQLQLLSEPPAKLREQLRARGLDDRAFCIVGGGSEKNQSRVRSIPHFTRDDGAWFDFTLTVREHAGKLDVLAYDFELRLPPGMGLPFLRFDLNLPGHANEDRELRSHIHLGSDDHPFPAPMMTPSELLHLCLEGGQLPAGRGKQQPTAFEIDWFEQTHAILKP
jgi:hypothetical protein